MHVHDDTCETVRRVGGDVTTETGPVHGNKRAGSSLPFNTRQHRTFDIPCLGKQFLTVLDRLYISVSKRDYLTLRGQAGPLSLAPRPLLSIRQSSPHPESGGESKQWEKR